MLTPKVERLPPVTVEFLRIVRGVEAVRLYCEGCKAVYVAPLADLGLPDDLPFPPAKSIWKCSLCGDTHIVATPVESVGPKREGEAPTEMAAPPASRDAVTEDDGTISPALRDRLEAVTARLRRTEDQEDAL